VSNESAAVDKVVVEGRITPDNSGEMRASLSKALRGKPATLTVDLSGVTYIDSSGVATLLEAVRIARKQGTRLVLAGVHDQTRYLLEITHLDSLFDIAGKEPGK